MWWIIGRVVVQVLRRLTNVLNVGKAGIGLVIVQMVVLVRLVREDILIPAQGTKINKKKDIDTGDDQIQDHTLLNHLRGREEEDIRKNTGDTAGVEAQGERKRKGTHKGDVHHRNQYRDRQSVPKDQRVHLVNEKGQIKKELEFRNQQRILLLLSQIYIIVPLLFRLYLIIQMKRTISELKSNTEYSEINDMQKQLYLENQKRLQQTEAIVIDEDKEDKKDKEMEQEQLCFEKGTFCINCLTQYPKEERKEHIMPFVNLLFENSNIDAKVQKPKKSLQNALMTCYGFEDQLLEPLAKQGIELTIVNDNDNANKKTEIIEKYRGYQNWLIIKPSKHGSNSYGGAFHPKIWILKFPNFIRIVIGSQNLHVADWTVWSQAMWVQDFKKGSSKLDDNSSEFKTLLKEFMLDILPTNYKFQDLLKITFDDYDFSNINIRLITSIPGRYTGNSLYKYGIMRLYNVINQEQLKNKFEQKSSAITYQTTSIGQLEYNYIDLIKQCCIGKSYKPTSEGQATLSNQNSIAQESQLKLIYPTMDYIVNKTHGGIDFANPLFLKKQQFENPKFPKQLFHRFQGNEHYYWHEGTIPHLKVIIITNLECEINDESSIYIGSHNLSLAAWGKLEKNNTQLFIANTELGVLYPPGKDTTEIKKDIINKLPFKFPPEKYEKDEKPWIAELYYELQQK